MKKVNKNDAKKWEDFIDTMNNNRANKVVPCTVAVKRKSSDNGNQVFMDFAKFGLVLFGLSVLITVILS